MFTIIRIVFRFFNSLLALLLNSLLIITYRNLFNSEKESYLNATTMHNAT